MCPPLSAVGCWELQAKLGHKLMENIQQGKDEKHETDVLRSKQHWRLTLRLQENKKLLFE
jgi:hypothetical protein